MTIKEREEFTGEAAAEKEAVAKAAAEKEAHTKILKKAEVVLRVGLSYSTIFRMCRDGTFPLPIQLSTRRVGWEKTLVDAWIERRGGANGGAPVRRAKGV